MFPIKDFNPLIPIPPDLRPIFDGGQYEDGQTTVSGGIITYDGGLYRNGDIIRPPIFRPTINGGVY